MQVALRRPGGADADRLIGEAHVHQIGIGAGVHSDRFDALGLAGAQDAQGDLTAVRYQDFFQHGVGSAQMMEKRGWSNSTGSPFSTSTASIVPETSASIWFIIFMASTIHSTSPALTVLPTSTKAAEEGDGER